MHFVTVFQNCVDTDKLSRSAVCQITNFCVSILHLVKGSILLALKYVLRISLFLIIVQKF